jgi:hypothetical protein
MFPVTFTANSYTTPNYTLEISPASQTAPVNTAAIFNGTLQGTDCYNSRVNLSCGSNHPPSCTVVPTSLVPTVSPAPAAPFTVTVSSNVAQTYAFNVAAVGTDNNKIAHSFLATFVSTGSTVPPGFSFTISPSSSLQSLPAGQPAIYDLAVVPTGGPFPGNVVLAFSNNCPPLSTCALSSTQVSKGSSGSTKIIFTITTTAPVIAGVHRGPGRMRHIYALWFSLPGLIVVLGRLRQSRPHRKRFVLFSVLTLLALGMGIACGGLQGNGPGGNGQAGTPSGPYTMTVSATMSGLPQQTAQVELTVN